ncbi:MAG: HAD-IIB family hydrolase [Oceanicoccus sp.]
MELNDVLKSELIIFTDLDSTLLDHHSYSFDAASSALATIKQRGYPLLLVSSKTLSELQHLQLQLDITSPLVCENGAAIYWHQDGRLCDETFGINRQQLLREIHHLRQQHNYRFQGFSDYSVEEISALTGLDDDSARRAANREFTEPLLWEDTEQRYLQFCEQLTAKGLCIQQGGRFRTVMGNYSKGTALEWVKLLLNPDHTAITVALGDSPNDQDMLNNADIAVVIPSAHSDKLVITNPSWVIYADKSGPVGWQRAMDQILLKHQ